MDLVGTDDRWLYAWGLGSVAAGAASLLVPLYVVELGGGPVELGVLAATAAVVGAPGALVVGRVAERATHRRRILLAGLSAVGLSLAALPLLSSVAAVVVVNAVLWLVWASVAPVLTMLVVDGVPESALNRRIGRLNAYQGYGWAGGLVLGVGWTAVGGRVLSPLLAQRTLFLACALCAAGGLVGAARSLPVVAAGERTAVETRRIARFVVGSRRTVKGATFAFTPNRLYWTTRAIHPRRLLDRFTPALGAYFLAAFCFFAGSAAFWAPLPALLTRRGYGSGVVFGLYLAASLASAVLYTSAGRLSDRYDTRHVLAGALGVRGVVFPLVAVLGPALAVAAVALPITTVLLTLVGATWAAIAVAGTATVTRLAPAPLRAEALGVYTALGAVAGGTGSLFGGLLAASSYRIAFGVAGGIVLVGAGVVFVTRTTAGPQVLGDLPGPDRRL